jgi:hypothetical protein
MPLHSTCSGYSCLHSVLGMVYGVCGFCVSLVLYYHVSILYAGSNP